MHLFFCLVFCVHACMLSLQSCPPSVTLQTVAHQSPLSVILQARILEWGALLFSRYSVSLSLLLPLLSRSVVSDSVRPHRRQPTRLPRPWDSPGKNTGVGCHFLLQCMKVESESEVAQLCPTLSLIQY